MPAYPGPDAGLPSPTLIAPTYSYYVFAESSSEAAALPNGQRALTPIIAGSISGSLVIIAWVVAAIAALVKRHHRRQQLKAEGRLDLLHEAAKPRTFILPPDPAVVQGSHEPGEHIHFEKKKKGKGRAHRQDEALQLLPRQEESHDSGAPHYPTTPLKPLPEVPSEDPSKRDLTLVGSTGDEKSALPSGMPSLGSDSQSTSRSTHEQRIEGLPAAADFAYPPVSQKGWSER